MAETQNYKNHRRFHAPFHFVLAPLLFAHLVYTIVRMAQEPNFDRAEAILLALVLFGILLLSRLNALKVQDRVIRLEERLRYSRVLPADLTAQAANLPMNRIIALRFASDEELPQLVARAVRNEFGKPDEIKRGVQNWRADDLRV